ncbi:MAG: ribonuclease III family protein [Candidatus Hodarchaeota archaeon]
MSEDVSSNSPLKGLFQEIIGSNRTWLQLTKDKQIAQLGDSLTNFIYSLAVSLAKGKCTGTRVPDTVLANAYHSSILKTIIPTKGKKGQVGDVVEAALLLSWLFGQFELEEMVTILVTHLKISKRPTRKEEFLAATTAFKTLLDEISPLFSRNS